MIGVVGCDQHGGSRAQAHHSRRFLVGLRSLRDLVPPYIFGTEKIRSTTRNANYGKATCRMLR